MMEQCPFCMVWTELETSGLCRSCAGDPRKIGHIVDEWQRLAKEVDSYEQAQPLEDTGRTTATDEGAVVVLANSQTQVHCTPSTRLQAIGAAFYVTWFAWICFPSRFPIPGPLEPVSSPGPFHAK
jgi:hypothetical protein